MKNNMFDNLKAVVANTRTNDIKMIDIDELHESDDNFFVVENIEQFAQTILGQGGVKDNLIVRPLETGGYEIISGHRRRAAVQYLLDKGENIVRVLPCLVQNYADEDEKLDDCEVELTTLLSSGSGIFYQVCEPYLNEKPSIYLKKIFHGAYYKYDGTTETARKITAARAIESKYGTDDYNDKDFEKNPEAIVNKNITYNWHSSGSSSSKIKVTLEDATEYVKAKKAQVKVLKGR